MLHIFVICAAAYLILLVLKVALAMKASPDDLHKEPLALLDDEVTVLQAILSGDKRLSSVLESNLLPLAKQRFLWLCDEDDAEGLRITDDLIARHPEMAVTRLLSPPCPDGVNPKVFKLMKAAGQVTTPFFLVLDDDTHLPEDTAAALVQQASTHDIATGLPYYADARGLPSALLAEFVNNNSAMTYLSPLPLMPPVSINGMCYAMRSDHLGVFAEISQHLTDDLALANLVRRKGGRIHQSFHTQRISTEVRGLRHYIRQMHRWHLFALLLLGEQPMSRKLVIFLMQGWHPFLLAAMFVMAAAVHTQDVLMVLAGVLVMRWLLISTLNRRLFGPLAARPFLSLLSELLQPFHLIHALCDRRIDWRGRRYRVHASDRFEATDG